MLRQKHAGIASLKPGLVHIPPIYLTRRAAAPKGAVALFASCRQRLPDNALVNETVCPLREALPQWSGSNLRSLTGDFKMMTLKAIALVVGAGFIFAMSSGELGADVVLAVVACLS